jgi:hypothetical protein
MNWRKWWGRLNKASLWRALASTNQSWALKPLCVDNAHSRRAALSQSPALTAW